MGLTKKTKSPDYVKVVGALSCKRRARKSEDLPALFLTLRDVSHVHLLARKLAFEFALIAECVEMPCASRVVVSIQAPIARCDKLR